MKRYHRDFTALNDVSFDIKKGETIGIIGRNGSGKSTLLQLICGVLIPTSGRVRVNGRISALLELGAGFNPEFTGRENVIFQGALLGMERCEMLRRLDNIVAFAEIGDFLDQPVRTYSSGMFVRLAFATAIHVDPEILVVDEALSVGDIDFQAKCLMHMRNLMDSGITVLFVSHSMQAISANCSRVLLLEHGRTAFDGQPDAAIERHRGHIVTGFAADLTECNNNRRGRRDAVELLGLDLANADGEPCVGIAMGERIRIRLTLKASEDLPQARFGILLTNPTDTLIHDFASAFDGLVGLTRGTHTYEITTDPLMVYPGTYYLGAWAQQAMAIPSDDYVRAAIAFTVADGHRVGAASASFDAVRKANTEVYLPCRWRKLN